MVAPTVSKQTATPRRPKSGSARKRAHQDVDREHRAQAVADDHDFIHRRFARPRNQRLRETIEPRIDIGPAAVKIVLGEDPVVQQLLHPPAAAGPPQQSEEDGEAGHQARPTPAPIPFQPEQHAVNRRAKNHPPSANKASDKIGKQKKAGVARVRHDVAEHRAGRDEIEHRRARH